MRLLSKKEVVDMMEDGWELGCSVSVVMPDGKMTTDGRWWLQKGGCGYGGDIKTVHGNVIYALINQNTITKKKYGFPTTTYKLVK